MFFFLRLVCLSIRKFGIYGISFLLVCLMLTSAVSGQDSDNRISSTNAQRLDAAIAAFGDGKLDESIRVLEEIVTDSTATAIVKKKSTMLFRRRFYSAKINRKCAVGVHRIS